MATIYGRYSATYYDLKITNIYNKRNKNEIINGNIHLFNAGKMAEKDKLDLYVNRFIDLNNNNYFFTNYNGKYGWYEF